MFAKLTGYINEILEDYIILDVNGVGYMIFCSNKTISQISDIKEKISLYVETIVKEESITLFGFLNQLDKEVFNTLCKVNGVGSKVAIKIISVLSINEISTALINGDSKAFCRVQGIGPKLATRITSELKNCSLTKNLGINISLEKTDINVNTNIFNDAVDALEGLGYQKSHIRNIVINILKERPDLTLESVITNSLKKINNLDPKF